MKKIGLILFIPGVVFTLMAAQAQATPTTLGFFNITGNSAINAGTATQYTVEVQDLGGGRVSFTFRNTGPAASSITDVYFDDGALLGIASITNGPGVSFSQGASPGNLPGGNSISPPFVTTAGFLADSDPAVQPNGVNPGEFLQILFDLRTGTNFNDVLADLTTGALRIGIHVQGFADGGSESFVNVPLPEPAALLLAIPSILGPFAFGVWRSRK